MKDYSILGSRLGSHYLGQLPGYVLPKKNCRLFDPETIVPRPSVYTAYTPDGDHMPVVVSVCGSVANT